MSSALQDSSMSPRPVRAVLDTNVVLDAWWFGDPTTRALRHAIEGGHLQWLLTAAMVAEARDVLGRAPFAHDVARCERVLSGMDRFAEEVGPPDAVSGGAPALRCRDPDDQVFLDLAVVLRPCWLISRDAALLTLAQRAGGWSCRIVTPAAWAVQQGLT